MMILRGYDDRQEKESALLERLIGGRQKAEPKTPDHQRVGGKGRGRT